MVRPALAEQVIGLTAKAIELKIARGDWVEGREFFRAPDGNIYVYLPGFYNWVRSGGQKKCRKVSTSVQTPSG